MLTDRSLGQSVTKTIGDFTQFLKFFIAHWASPCSPNYYVYNVYYANPNVLVLVGIPSSLSEHYIVLEL
jgi:hypothetical protein